MCVRNAMGLPKTDSIPMLQHTPFAGRTGLTMCDVLHPERNGSVACDAHFLGVFPELFRRSIGVYLPVYAASTIAVQRAAVLKQPLHFAVKMLSGALRSSVFLTTYVALAHRGTSAYESTSTVQPLLLVFSRSGCSNVRCICFCWHGNMTGRRSSHRVAAWLLQVERANSELSV